LSEAAYRAGLRRIDAALDEAEARGETLTFTVDTDLAMIVGHRSPNLLPTKRGASEIRP